MGFFASYVAVITNQRIALGTSVLMPMWRRGGSFKRVMLPAFALAALTVALCAGVWPCSIGAAEPSARDTLARGIQDAVEQVHAVRAERLRLERDREERTKQLDAQIRRLRENLADVERVAAERQLALDASETQAAPHRAMAASASRRLADSVRAAARGAERMRARVAAGIAFRREERLAALDALLQRLRGADAPDAARAAEAWLDFAAGELRLARTLELVHEPVLYAGGERRAHAALARIGLVASFFVSEERTVSAWSGLGTSDWIVVPEDAERERLAQALDVMERRRAPQWTPLPVHVAAWLETPHDDSTPVALKNGAASGSR